MPASASELGSGSCTAVLETPRTEPESLAVIQSRTQTVWIGGRLTVEPELELIKLNDHVPSPGVVPVEKAAKIKQHPFCKSGVLEVGHLASMVR